MLCNALLFEWTVLEGKSSASKEFGAFVRFAPGKEGMVHILKFQKKE